MKKVCAFILAFGFCIQINAQLVTTNTMTPAQLVTQVLLGAGVTASNITFTGDVKQRTQFNSVNTGLGISSGVFLSTGNGLTSSASGPQGPNNSSSTSTAYYTPGDPLLDIASGNPTFDAAILEFDFVPMGDSVKFRYCFGSEEYPEFVNGGVNDVFGFFLSGPNPAGGNYTNRNIALVPGTTIPVSIDNVNQFVNTTYYRDNSTTSPINVEFDGVTVVLYALEKVVCGQTYHIKIAIADGGDEIYDSGVFLQGGSFTSAAPISVSSSNANLNFADSLVLVEDCNANCVYFIRSGNVALADSFSLQVGGNAILGTDYINQSNTSFTWPAKIYFAAGQDSVSICNIYALEDLTPEPVDTIKFSISTFTTGLSVCALPATVSFNLYIKDYSPIVIGQGDSSFCNQVPTLIAHASGGVPGYYYNWMPGGGGASTFNAGTITSTTIFTLTVGDACNRTTTKSFSVNITPTVTVLGASICAGETAVLTATGATTYSWSTGATTNPISVSPIVNTTYTITGFMGPCTNTAVTTVSIITTPTVNVTGNNAICEGQNTTLTATGAASYIWSTNETTASINVSPSVTTNYIVTGGVGTCTASVVYPVNVTAMPTMSITGNVICSGQTASITASGASSYLWNTGETGSQINPEPSSTTVYSVTGANGNCTNTAVYTQSVTTGFPTLEQVGPYKFCVDTITKVPVIVTSDNPNYTITWTIPGGGLTPYDTIGKVYYFTSSQPSAGIYTITVTDLCNKKSSVQVDISVTTCDIVIPNVITANGDNTNEYFKIKGLESFSNSILSVYNRWGNKVYSNNNYTNDWKPDVNAGTYFYVLSLADGRKFNGFLEVFKN